MAEPNKLFVSNLAPGTQEDTLTALFSSYGLVIDCVVMAPKGHGGRHSAFVKFSTPEEAELARAAMEGYVMDGDTEVITIRLAGAKAAGRRPVAPLAAHSAGFIAPVSRFRPHSGGPAPLIVPQYQQISPYQPDLKRRRFAAPDPQGQGVKLYIANLEPDTDDAALLGLFAPYGDILEAFVIRTRQGKGGRLSGFVRFVDPNVAHLAVQTMNNVVPATHTARITVKFA